MCKQCTASTTSREGRGGGTYAWANLLCLLNIVTVHQFPATADLYSKVVPHHAIRWRTVGIELGLAKSVLDSIEDDYPHNMNRMQRMLDKWILQDGINATWAKLETAITNVQRAELALESETVVLLDELWSYWERIRRVLDPSSICQNILYSTVIV